VSGFAPSEIQALARIIDELDYYQLIDVTRGANARDVKKAYYTLSRSYHPDANRHLDGSLRVAVEQISKRITEAYAVLRDPGRREAYDRVLDGGDGVRLQLAQAKNSARKQATENQGATPQGRQYYSLAKTAMTQQDWNGAFRNLQTAMAFEPGNAFFKDKLAEVKAKLK
jgi:DnaJ-class molecular chaperone